MLTTGFSWPSTAPWRSPRYSSPKAIGVGLAPSWLKMSIVMVSSGVRIFSPARSSGASMGRTELVMSRIPLSQKPSTWKPFSSERAAIEVWRSPSSTS